MERKWMDLVLERLNRRNAVLFRAQDPLLRPLAEALGQASRLLAAQPEEAGPGEKWAAFLLR